MPQLDFISINLQYWIVGTQLVVLYFWGAYIILPLILRNIYLRSEYASELFKDTKRVLAFYHGLCELPSSNINIMLEHVDELLLISIIKKIAAIDGLFKLTVFFTITNHTSIILMHLSYYFYCYCYLVFFLKKFKDNIFFNLKF